MRKINGFTYWSINVRLLLAIVIILKLNDTFPQSSFLKKFNYPGEQIPRSIITDSQSNFILMGESQISATGDNLTFVVKTDSSANIIWKKYFGGPALFDQGRQIINNPNGYVILAIESPNTTLRFLDRDGNLLSQKILSITTLDAQSVCRNDFNEFLLAGSQVQPKSVFTDIGLAKLDGSGNTLWIYHYGSPGQNVEAVKVCPLNDGGFIVTAKRDDGNPINARTMIIKVDRNGQEVWMQVLGGTGEHLPVDMIKTSDGNFIILSFDSSSPSLIELAKINGDGTVLWERQLQGTTGAGAQRLVETPSGDFIIVGEKITPAPYPLYSDNIRSVGIWGVSAQGEFQWEREYLKDSSHDSPFNSASDITKANDGTFMVTGKFYTGTDYDFFLLKIGVDGCLISTPDLGRDSSTCAGAIKLNAGKGFDFYRWNTGASDSTITVDSTGVYSVQVSFRNGCSRSDTVRITLKDCFVLDRCKNVGYEKKEIYIPNVITPNADGLNDQFKVPEMLLGSRLAIFNRWGSEVYSNNSYNDTWSGEGLPYGVYYYSLSNPCLNRDFKGAVTILK